jgi:hypothetical protein
MQSAQGRVEAAASDLIGYVVGPISQATVDREIAARKLIGPGLNAPKKRKAKGGGNDSGTGGGDNQDSKRHRASGDISNALSIAAPVQAAEVDGCAVCGGLFPVSNSPKWYVGCKVRFGDGWAHEKCAEKSK